MNKLYYHVVVTGRRLGDWEDDYKYLTFGYHESFDTVEDMKTFEKKKMELYKYKHNIFYCFLEDGSLETFIKFNPRFGGENVTFIEDFDKFLSNLELKDEY